MKGLLMKDFYQINKYCRISLLIAVVFALCAAVGDNMFIRFYPVVMGSIIPVTLISYDEKSKWQVYAETFPYTRKEMVTVKYLVALIYLAVIIPLSAAAQAVYMLRAAGEFSLPSYLSVVLSMLAAGLIVPGIMLPPIFKLGIEKGRMAYYVVLAAAFGLFGALGMLTDMDVTRAAPGLGKWLAPALLAAGIVIFAGSWMLSVKFYQEREM